MSMNEELQSTNEELATVNEELKNKVEQLGRANSDLQNFIESTQVPTIFLDRKMRIRSFTPATKALFRFQDQDQGRPLSDVVSRTDQRQLEEIGRKVLESGDSLEQELEVENGAESHVVRVLPYRDLNGAIDGVIFVFSDVTKIRQAQADLARNEGLARQRSHEIETLYKTAPVGLALVDRNQRYLKINQQFADLNGHPIEKHLGRTLQEVMPALAEKMERPIAEVFERSTPVTNLEASVRLDGNGIRDFLIDLYPYEEEALTTAVGIVLKDVTELRRLEKELRRLMDELQHRVKNTLATVASIVNQTVASSANRAALIDTLKLRIGALAATHNLLTQRNWKDASLRQILKAELKPFDHEERISISGPAVMLPPKHALTLTLTLHELATNAAKYGALAHEGATLAIEWMVSVDGNGRALTLDWKESGVPNLRSEDAKESFGTRLIRNGVVHDLQGQCTHRLGPGGLVCTIQVPY
jgi:two-component system CheB/CheR fusion protein